MAMGFLRNWAGMFEQEFADLFTQTVLVSQRTSTDAYGMESYGPDQPVPCHLEGRVQEIVTPTGEVRTSTGRFFCEVVPWINDLCRLKVPDFQEVTGYRNVDIVAVSVRYDEDGPHHLMVHYGERGNKGFRSNA